MTLPTTADGRSAFAIAERAVRAAGAIIVERLPEMTGPRSARTVVISTKEEGRNNIVTDVDQAAEDVALAVLGSAFPDHAVLAEESGARPGTSSYTWYLDPLDGTRNFALGIPHVAVNLALADVGRLVLALTYDPVRDELFHAIEGGGAWLNDRSIAVSEETKLNKCVLGLDMGYVDDKGKLLLEALTHVWPGLQSLRFMGSAALGLAYAAAGRVQVYAHHPVQPWDIAPGILIVREAGGVVTDLRGEPAEPDSGRTVAASPAAHEAFMAATAGLAWRDA